MRGWEKKRVRRPPRVRRRREPCLKRNQTLNQTSGESLVSFPTPATLFHFPFQLPFSGGKGKHPGWGGVLACRRFRDSPNLSIGESSEEDEKARASSCENFANKSNKRGTGIEAPRSRPDVRDKTPLSAHKNLRNVDILECFPLAAPRPRGKPRGTQRAFQL